MKLLGVEAVPGGVRKTWLHSGDDGKDRFTTETVVDVEPLLKRNAEKMASASRDFKGDVHEVADIPAIVIEQMCRQHDITLLELMQCRTDKARRIMNSLLNDREFRAFRTKPGRVKVGA
jgi:hypothetical protein